MDSEELKLQISFIQAEKDHLTMLLSEYTNDNILIKGERAVKSRNVKGHRACNKVSHKSQDLQIVIKKRKGKEKESNNNNNNNNNNNESLNIKKKIKKNEQK